MQVGSLYCLEAIIATQANDEIRNDCVSVMPCSTRYVSTDE